MYIKSSSRWEARTAAASIQGSSRESAPFRMPYAGQNVPQGLLHRRWKEKVNSFTAPPSTLVSNGFQFFLDNKTAKAKIGRQFISYPKKLVKNQTQPNR
jgi:hypothetical protein